MSIRRRAGVSDRTDRIRVRLLLRSAGLRSERIPPSATGKRCDLRALDDGVGGYLIEIKGIHDDEATVSTFRKTMQGGEVFDADRRMGASRSIGDKIDKAMKQVRETAGGRHDDLWLIALVDRGRIWSQTIMNQIIATLYGIRVIAEVCPNGKTRKCLYFSRSAFHKLRLGPDRALTDAIELDGAIILGAEGAGLCVNDYSPQAQRLCNSRLGRFFAEPGLLHTVERIEREGRFLVADCDIDRKDEYAVLQYLAAKYGLTRPVVMESSAWAGAFYA